MTQRDVDADVVFRKSLSDFVPNILFFGLGFLAILLLGRWLRFVALLGIAAFGLLLLINVVRTLVALGLGVLLLFTGTSAASRGTEAKFWAAKAMLFAETLVYAVFVWLLYLSFFAAG